MTTDNSGWIKIHRKFLSWEWYGDNNVKVLFLHLILLSNHVEKRYRGILLKRGSVITGRKMLASQLGISVQEIRTALDKLVLTNEITIKTSSKGSIIQVVKYKDYQIATNESTNEQPTSNQRATTNKNVKNVKNVKNKDVVDFDLLKKYFNKLFGKNIRIVNDKTKSQINARIKEGYTKDDLIKAMRNAKSDEFHKDSNYKHITLEFISRQDKLDKFSQMDISISKLPRPGMLLN